MRTLGTSGGPGCGMRDQGISPIQSTWLMLSSMVFSYGWIDWIGIKLSSMVELMVFRSLWRCDWTMITSWKIRRRVVKDKLADNHSRCTSKEVLFRKAQEKSICTLWIQWFTRLPPCWLVHRHRSSWWKMSWRNEAKNPSWTKKSKKHRCCVDVGIISKVTCNEVQVRT